MNTQRKPNRIRRIIFRLLSAVALLIIGLVIVLFATRGTSTPEFADADNAIAEERMLTLGGVEQSVLLRGRDRTAPLLVYVHGGPGMTATPFLRTYNADLEDHFVVVYWDQRGTSKSYSDDLDPADMTIAQITSDLGELIDTVLAEFNQEQVLLVGHSWGTIPALAHVATAPETVAAYVAVAQTTNQIESDTVGYEWALAEAQATGNTRSVERLEAIGAPPYTIDEFVTQRQQVNFLGGTMVEPLSDLQLARIAIRTDEFAWPNLGPLVNGVQFSGAAIWDEQQQYDAFTRHPSIDAPIFLLVGRHDRVISPDLGAAYIDSVDAPQKEVIWFENSAHSPQFDEPEAFNATVIDIAEQVGLLSDLNSR